MQQTKIFEGDIKNREIVNPPELIFKSRSVLSPYRHWASGQRRDTLLLVSVVMLISEVSCPSKLATTVQVLSAIHHHVDSRRRKTHNSHIAASFCVADWFWLSSETSVARVRHPHLLDSQWG